MMRSEGVGKTSEGLL